MLSILGGQFGVIKFGVNFGRNFDSVRILKLFFYLHSLIERFNDPKTRYSLKIFLKTGKRLRTLVEKKNTHTQIHNVHTLLEAARND